MPSYIKSLKSNLGDLIIPRTTATAVTYDNSTSELNAIDVQGAIEELHSNQKQIIAPMQMPGYTTIVSSDGMSQSAYSTALSINNIRGNTVLGGTPAYDAPVSMNSVESPITLNVSGKNIIAPKWHIDTQTQVGVTCTRNGNSFTVDGLNTAQSGANFYIQRYDTETSFSLPAGTYTISGMPPSEELNLFLGLYQWLPEGKSKQLARDYGNPSHSKQTFTLTEATDNLYFVITAISGKNVDSVTITPQIEVGSEVTEYEEPSNTIVEIPLLGTDGQALEPLRMTYTGLASNKTPAPDRLIRKDGIWYVERNVSLADLTNAVWTRETGRMVPRLNGVQIRGKTSSFPLSTHFNAAGANPETEWNTGIRVGGYIIIYDASLPNGADTTVEEMTAWCAAQDEAGTPVLVCYARKEPVYEELHQDVQVLLNTLIVPSGTCSVWFSGEIIPSSADIGIPRGDFPSENARALAMTRADRTLSNLTDYQKALHNIGGRPNRNLLINHRMIGTGNPGSFPVNQKGQKVYTPDLNETTIDGWKIEITDPGTVKVEIKDGFVTITNTSQTSGIQFKQIVPIEELSASGEYTISSYIKEVSADVSCILAMTDSPYINPIRIKPVPNEIVSGTVTALPQVSSGSYKFIYEIPPGGFVTIADQKMEEGPIQTLGWKDDTGIHLFETPDYGEELAQCQRYLIVETAENEKPGTAYSNTSGVFTISTAVQMRTTPVLSELKGYEPKIALSDGSTVLITKEEITVLGADVSGVRIRVDVTGDKTLKLGPASIRDCNMVLSAEL